MRNPNPNISGIIFSSMKVCAYCENEFESNAYRGKYCSLSCGKRDRYESSVLNSEWRLNRLVSMAKNRATTKRVAFNIDTEYVYSLWNKQDGKCAVSGLDLDLTMSDRYSTNPQAPSIDRIIPALGYVRGNIRIVCYQVNIALSEYGEEQLMKMCKAIVAYR